MTLLHVCSFRFYFTSFCVLMFSLERFTERFIHIFSIHDCQLLVFCALLPLLTLFVWLLSFSVSYLWRFAWNLTILSKLFTLLTVSINAWYIFKWRCCIMMPAVAGLFKFIHKHDTLVHYLVRRFQSDTTWWVQARAFVCVRAWFHVCVCAFVLFHRWNDCCLVGRLNK